LELINRTFRGNNYPVYHSLFYQGVFTLIKGSRVPFIKYWTYFCRKKINSNAKSILIKRTAGFLFRQKHSSTQLLLRLRYESVFIESFKLTECIYILRVNYGPSRTIMCKSFFLEGLNIENKGFR